MVNKILVPVDGSVFSQRAVSLATDLATKYSAELVLVHVMNHHGSGRIPPGLEEYSTSEHIQITEHDFLQAAADRILDEAERLVLKQGDIKPDKLTVIGHPAREIAKYANEQSFDLVVMGSRGLSDVGGLLLGSVSHKVTHLTNCSCLLVK